MPVIPRTAVAAALEVENYVVKELDRGLGLGAGIVLVGGGEILVAKHLAYYLVMPGPGIEQQLCRNVAEHVRGETDAGMIEQGARDLPPETADVLGIVVAPREEVGVGGGQEQAAPVIDIDTYPLRRAARQDVVQR